MYSVYLMFLFHVFLDPAFGCYTAINVCVCVCSKTLRNGVNIRSSLIAQHV